MNPSKLLINSILDGDLAACRLNLSGGADANATDDKGIPALAIAASRRNPEIVRALLEYGANMQTKITIPNQIADGPIIHLPTANGSEEVLRLLLIAGANPNDRDATGMTPLMLSAFQGHVRIAALLLDSEAELEAKDSMGYTPLIFAANAGQQKMVEFLLSKGANPNAKDNQNSTPVMFAAQHGFDVIVRRLLTSGADVLARGTHGLTAVDLAVQNKHHETLQILQR